MRGGRWAITGRLRLEGRGGSVEKGGLSQEMPMQNVANLDEEVLLKLALTRDFC